MAKLISRTSDRILMRKRGEPAFHPWSDWTVCEGTEGLEPGELKRLASEWHKDDERVITGSDWGWELRVRTPYDKEEYRVVTDGFDCADYNKRLKE
jgi:hypothetical protein